MDKSTTPTRRAKRKIVLEEESCESPQKVLIKFVSVEECGLIEVMSKISPGLIASFIT